MKAKTQKKEEKPRKGKKKKNLKGKIKLKKKPKYFEGGDRQFSIRAAGRRRGPRGSTFCVV